MSRYHDQHILISTKAWIAEFVIKHELCPFAHVSFQSDSIKYEVSESDEPRALLEIFYGLCQELNQDPNISNGFLILPTFSAFEVLLDLKYICDIFLKDINMDTSYQTVAFHPLFKFAGEGPMHPGNFVNRSPYPMLHLLRAEEVSQAIGSLEDPDAIPIVNQEKLEKLGYDYLADSLKNYKD